MLSLRRMGIDLWRLQMAASLAASASAAFWASLCFSKVYTK